MNEITCFLSREEGPLNLGRETFKVGVTSWRIVSFALARNSARSEYKVRNSQTLVRNKT